MLKRLSELLQENPELRAKMLTQQESNGDIFRNEFSTLRNRQLAVLGLTKDLDGEEEALRKKLENVLKSSLLEFSDQTTQAMGNAQIWIPKEATEEQRNNLNDAFSNLSNTAEKLAMAPIGEYPKVREQFEQIAKDKAAIETLLADEKITSLNSDFTGIRQADLKAMQGSLDRNLKILGFLEEKKYSEALTLLQKEINADTTEAVFALSMELSKLSGMSQELDDKIDALMDITEVELMPAQESAVEKLESEKPVTAVPHQEKSAELLYDSVKLLDKVITEFVVAKSKIESDPPPEGSTPAQDPTEAEIQRELEKALAALEKETRGSDEKKLELGIGSMTNLQMKSDWQKENKSEEEKKKMEEQRRQMQQKSQQQKQQAQKAQRAAAMAQHTANQQRSRLNQKLKKQVAVPWKKNDPKSFGGTATWNKLASELKRSLTQDNESDVPEQYRESIEQYFRDIAESSEGR